METLQLLPVNRDEFVAPTEIISTSKPFIEANTIPSNLEEIRTKHIIPVYSKDNERLISISEFVETCYEVVHDVYRGESILAPNIRLSHPIKGRLPEAKNKSANELQEWEKTLYYERAAFIIEIPSFQTEIDGNTMSLTIAGVKSYNNDKLHGKKGADEYFSFCVGFNVSVCTNLCVWSDGYSSSVGVKSLGQLRALMYELFRNYNSSSHLYNLRRLADVELTEHQFAQLIGRCRMYPQLPTDLKRSIHPLLFGDSQINSIVKDYYKDASFCRQSNGNINLWKLFNLFTGANKNSYVDLLLDRSVNAYNFVEQIRGEIENSGQSWFLS
jgi:hypothetical protein